MLTPGVDNIVGTSGNDSVTGLWGHELTAGGTLITPATLSTLDAIDGGAGENVLNVNIQDGGTELTGVNTTRMQTVNVKSTGAATVDTTSGFTGVTKLNITQTAGNTAVTAEKTTDVSVSGVTGGTITVDGGKNVTVNDDFGAASTGKNITIGATTGPAGTITVTDTKQFGGKIDIDGGTDVTVTATTDAIAAVTGGTIKVGLASTPIAPTGVVSITQNLNSDGVGGNLVGGAISVKGGSSVGITVNATSKAKDKAASNDIAVGNITVTGDGKTTAVNVTQNKTVEIVTEAAGTEVKKTSVVTFAEMKEGQTVIINNLTFTAAKDLTAEEVAQAFANLTEADTQSAGGPVKNGFYTNTFNTSVWTSGAASGKTVTFTAERHDTNDLVIGAGTATAPTQVKTPGVAPSPASETISGNEVTLGAVQVDDVAAASITSVTLNGYTTADLGSTGTDLDALTTLSLANGTGAVNLATKATTLGLTVNNVAAADGSAVEMDIDKTAATIATLNVTATGKNSVIKLTGAAAVKDLTVSGDKLLDLHNSSTLTALENVVVKGSAGLNLGTLGTNGKSINTTATTGTVTASIDATKATYTGGDGEDKVTTTTTAPTKAISLGGGNDSVTLFGGTNAMGTGGTIDGGTGTNTLSMVAADAVTASGGPAFATKVTNFQKLVLTGATGAQDVKAKVLGNYNDVEVKGAAAASVLTVSELTSGATIRLNDNSNKQTIAKITDADKVTNKADVLNIVIGASQESDGSADDNGIVLADDVEKINISVNDILIQSPKNEAPDTQKLLLKATSADTITITGDTALDLTTSLNQKVTAINAADFTGALTVAAAGGVACSITGGSGDDHLTASTGAVAGVVNKTGASAVIVKDGTGTSTAGVDAKTEVQTLTITPDDIDHGNEVLTVTYDNDGSAGSATATVTFTLDAVDATNKAEVATGLAAALNADNGFKAVATATVGTSTGVNDHVVTITYKTADNYAQATCAPSGTTNGLAVANATVGGEGAKPVREVTTVTLTDGTNTGLTLGDTMSLKVGATTFTYTATAATETMDGAATALAELIAADTTNVQTAAYNGTTKVLTITAKTAGVAGLAVSNYAITDAAGGAAKGDILIGGAGNDTLVAGSLAQLTGGAGNDTFKMVTGLANINSYSTITDFSAGDILDTGGNKFVSTGITLQGTATFESYVNTAIAKTDANDVIWFQYGTNTYVVENHSNHATTFDLTQDFIIELTGLKDLSTASFNTTNGYLEMA